MRYRRIVATLALATCACAERLEFADWTIPVPEGTPVIEYAATTNEQRQDQSIELIEDLVIGDAPSRSHERFYRAYDLAVDASGQIYVMDTGNHRVQVFDREGGYVRTLGREGQGPGEFQAARQISVARDELVVTDNLLHKFSVWSLEGRHLRDYPFSDAATPERVTALGDGTLLGYSDVIGADGVERTVIARWGFAGEELARYADLPLPASFIFVGGGGAGMGFSVPSPLPSIAAYDPKVFFTVGSEYQIHAVTASAETVWALRVPLIREPFPEEWAHAHLRTVGERYPDVTRSELGFPELLPAIADLRVDGHGHLYVFPYVPNRRLTPSGECCESFALQSRPVDIYTRDGRRLFSGQIEGQGWMASLGDHVYQIVRAPNSDEQVVARYRLVEPF